MTIYFIRPAAGVAQSAQLNFVPFSSSTVMLQGGWGVSSWPGAKERMITATYISPCTYEMCILYQVELCYITACTHFILNKQTKTDLLEDNAELAHAVFHFH